MSIGKMGVWYFRSLISAVQPAIPATQARRPGWLGQLASSLSRSEIIRNNPIRDGLNSFRSTFKSTCEKHSFTLLTDSLGQIGAKGNVAILPRPMVILINIEFRPLVLDLVSALQTLPVSRQLSSNTGRGSLSGDLSRLYSEIDSELVDVDRLIPLLRDVINKEPDEVILTQAYAAVTESTPPPRPVSPV
jgi:hypothetical protein